MEKMDFDRCVVELAIALTDAADKFLRENGARPNWIEFYQLTSIDIAQLAREVLFFAGDIWPVHQSEDWREAA